MARSAAFILILVVAAGCASGPEVPVVAQPVCEATSEAPRCEAERLHARAERLSERLAEAQESYLMSGDDVRLACVETLSHRADGVVLMLSDTTRADREPVVVPLASSYVSALEQTFRERCSGS